MSSLAGRFLFNTWEGGEEQDDVVEVEELRMGSASVRGSVEEEIMALLLRKREEERENTGELGTATEQDMVANCNANVGSGSSSFDSSSYEAVLCLCSVFCVVSVLVCEWEMGEGGRMRYLKGRMRWVTQNGEGDPFLIF